MKIRNCVKVFSCLLLCAILLKYSYVYILGIFDRTKASEITQELSFIQKKSVWKEHIVTNNILYRGGQYLTEENMENIKVHSVNQCKSRRYLVYKCDSSSLCGGWGDRQNGIVSSFLLALLTNRTFIIDMTNPCKLENFLLSNVYNWSICRDYMRTLPKKNFTSFNYVVGSRKFLNQIKDFNFDRNWTAQVIGLRFNAYMRVIDQIRQHKQAKARLNWLLNSTNEEVIHRVLHTLFQPNQRLLDDAVKLNTNRIHDKHLVCSHIRKGKNPSIPGDNKLPRGTPNETLIFDFLKQYNDDRKYAIYIATDSDEVRRLAEESIKSYININRTIVHVDRLGKLKKYKEESCEGFYTVIFEQFMLSLCDTLVLTRSNFGGIAAYIRGISDNLFLYNQKTDIILPSNLTYMQRIFKFI
ncbi:uncharacterized protein LOC123538301 isoform X2 [Mercenaria mercenaria]|uniref:uncharacterized protein LOC123538301 isoform X2 n=1 Tax=Mercenaria mercenaria TaxID=6596 RepID=UPI00234F02E4|nr:uncharacterized protein LOC123538301 isoform X2 [Mercenaria mercenaria]